MTEVLEIERASFEYAWTEEDFLCCLRQRNCIGMVAEHEGRIVGFMVYEFTGPRFRMLNFAVHPDCLRQRVGGQMVQRMKDKLAAQHRREITLEVRERNLPAQLFWKSRGFTALGVLKGRYDDTAEDAYLMRFSLYQAEDDRSPWHPKNRVSQYIEPVE